MGFHSDNEKGVQGTIASLSLGSAAVMRFRPARCRKRFSTLKYMPTGRTNGDEGPILTLELRHVRSLVFLLPSCKERVS